MANTKIPVELSSTPGIVDNSNATAITIDSSENVGIGGTPTNYSDHKTLSLYGNTGTGAGFIEFNDTSGNADAVIFSDDGNLFINADYDNTAAGSSIRFRVDGSSEKMRIDSSGNVGFSGQLYSNSPNSTLGGFKFFRNHANGDCFVFDTTTAPYAGDLIFGTTNTERMRIDSSGNVGIGVVPSAFLLPNGSTGALQLQSGGLLSAYNTNTYLSQNWYYNAGEKYIANGSASRYAQTGAEHIWSSAGNNTSGAGAGLSWQERMRIDSSGNLLVGRASSLGGGLLTVQSNNSQGLAIGYGTGTNEYRRLYHHSSGLYFESSTNQAYLSAAGAWTNASDVTLKKDIEDIDYGIETVKSLKPRKYKMKSDDEAQIGFIAQELVEQVPEIVGGREGLLGVSYGQLTAVLTKAIQEQQAQIDALQSEINELKNS